MDVNSLIASNLKSIREEKKLSLDNVSKITGVSKSMLGQIERGAVNPTISVLWRIANGLKISFTSLIEDSSEDIKIIKYDESACLVHDNGKYLNHPFFPFDEVRRFEIYHITIKSGGSLVAEAHLPGTEEFITVFHGAVTVVINETEYKLSKGDFLRFKADVSHSYRNNDNAAAELSMVIYYAK